MQKHQKDGRGGAGRTEMLRVLFGIDPKVAGSVEIAGTHTIIPAAIEMVDIAGLVAGASKGEGLGNKFLGHIRETQAIIHVVRCFESNEITHISEEVNPLADIEIIETELALADLETLEKSKENIQRKAKSGNKELLKELQLIQKLSKLLSEGKSINPDEFDDAEKIEIEKIGLISSKPVIYVANLDETMERSTAL